MQIVIVKHPLSRQEWQELAKKNFGEMLKGVVDVRQIIVAAGGELHADAEEVLLNEGSKQVDLWGFNFYPGRQGDDGIEYTSFITSGLHKATSLWKSKTRL